MAKKSDDGVAPIIVKKIKKGGAGHHGGAWKVAYADFVTAMMAFFLLLWLLNVTTKEQKDAISNYFDPSSPKVSQSTSGAGGVMGGLSMTKEGAMASTQQDLVQQQVTGKPSSSQSTAHQGTDSDDSQEKSEEQQLQAEEDHKFEQTKEDIDKAILQSEELKDLAKHLFIDITPEGLRIQIIDQDGDPMFPSGSAVMFEKTQKLMAKVAELIAKLPNNISVRGHTDAHAYPGTNGYTNWELSADRANASRKILEANGIPEKRIANVMGKSDTEPFVPKDPNDARNRRISIILLRETLQEAIKNGEIKATGPVPSTTPQPYIPAPPPAPGTTYQRTQGAVQFP
jgi:chemotaxis protein MotB